MIPLSAWVSLSVGALLIGLEYIAPAVVTAASNISPLLSFASPPPLPLAALSVPPLTASDPAFGAIRGVMCDKCEVRLVPTQIRERFLFPNVS